MSRERRLKRAPKSDGILCGIVYHLFNFVTGNIHEEFSILTLNGKKFEIPSLILDKKSLKQAILERKNLLLS